MPNQRIHLLHSLLGRSESSSRWRNGHHDPGPQLDTHHYHGDRFHPHHRDEKGNNDLLTLTQPHIIRGIHLAYLEAGADLIETSTFNSNAVSHGRLRHRPTSLPVEQRAEYAWPWSADAVHQDQSRQAALRRRRAGADQPHRVDFAGRERLGLRNVSFDELVGGYGECVRGLLDGGVDLLMVETVFDTLNCKAALFAIDDYFVRNGIHVPVMVSGTITDASGRTLSGQTTEAFWNSISHARPFSVGLNCALGAKDLRPYIEELAKIADVHTSLHPNAGLPNRLRRLRRNAGVHRLVPQGIRAKRFPEHRRRLLRHHAGAHQDDRRGIQRRGAAQTARH